MASQNSVDYVRPPFIDSNEPLTVAFTDAASVYLGPLGCGNYTIVASGGACHYVLGYWDAGSSETQDADGNAITVTTSQMPLADGVKDFFVIGEVQGVSFTTGMPTFGVAVIGAAGASGTLYVLRS